MRIITSLPATLSKVGPAVDSGSPANVDVRLDTDFPLGEFPYPLLSTDNVSGGTQLITQSGGFMATQDQAASSASSTIDLGRFDRGVWDFTFDFDCFSDFSGSALMFFIGFREVATPGLIQVTFFARRLRINTQQNGNMAFRATFDQPRDLRATVGATGVAQTISVHTSCIYNRVM